MRLLNLSFVAAMVACQATPPSPQDVSSTLSDDEACVVGILATSQGTPDLADLLKCGVTLADLWNLIGKLEQTSTSDAGPSALSPAALAWHQKLDGVRAQIAARDAGTK